MSDMYPYIMKRVCALDLIIIIHLLLQEIITHHPNLLLSNRNNQRNYDPAEVG